MTNSEYLYSSLRHFGFDQDDVNIILFKSKLSAEGSADARLCDEAIYDRFTFILSAMSQNVSEGGYSVSWNVEAVKLYYYSLCKELGKPNILAEAQAEEEKPKCTITNKSNLW